jgi:DNA-binding response OmpR family regulator
MEGDRKHCLESGMDDFLAKPVRPAELRAAIERWTRKANDPGDIARAA